MIYIENTMLTIAKSADYLGNAGVIGFIFFKERLINDFGFAGIAA
jgi:hypothetical protein